ncbi:hypothetical protein B0H13DRAFT_1851248 [Mycena leptocephala]|nr:hypothetical protein B0H13DRAFT_1851248 [Mycena leptocephala]
MPGMQPGSRGNHSVAPSADDDILLAAYASHTENPDAIEASALQACGDATQRASRTGPNTPAASAGTTELRVVSTRHSAADWDSAAVTHIAHDIRRQASGRRLLLHRPRAGRSRHRPSCRVSSSPGWPRPLKVALSRPRAELRRFLRRTLLAPPPPPNIILRVRPPQRDLLPRLLGKDEDKDARVLERQRSREAERGAPSAAELLTMYQSGQQTTASPTSYDFAVSSSPPFAFATARPCTRSNRHFPASTLLSCTSGSSDGHGGDLTLARPPAASAQTVGRSQHVSTDVKPTRTLPPNPAVAAARRVSSIKLLDGDANPDRSGEEICLLDGRLAAARLPGQHHLPYTESTFHAISLKWRACYRGVGVTRGRLRVNEHRDGHAAVPLNPVMLLGGGVGGPQAGRNYLGTIFATPPATDVISTDDDEMGLGSSLDAVRRRTLVWMMSTYGARCMPSSRTSHAVSSSSRVATNPTQLPRHTPLRRAARAGAAADGHGAGAMAGEQWGYGARALGVRVLHSFAASLLCSSTPETIKVCISELKQCVASLSSLRHSTCWRWHALYGYMSFEVSVWGFSRSRSLKINTPRTYTSSSSFRIAGRTLHKSTKSCWVAICGAVALLRLYLETLEEIATYCTFCENSTNAKVKSGWAHKISYPWLLPSLNRCLTLMPKLHWDLTPGCWFYLVNPNKISFSRKRYPPNDGAQTRDPVIAVRLRVVTQRANNFARPARLERDSANAKTADILKDG